MNWWKNLRESRRYRQSVLAQMNVELTVMSAENTVLRAEVKRLMQERDE